MKQVSWSKFISTFYYCYCLLLFLFFLQVEKDELVTSISINTLNELMTQVLASYCTEISQQLLTELMKQRDLRDQEE